jgi:hypothetical protein
MAFQPHKVEFSFGMALAMVVIILAITAGVGRNWAAPIPPTIYAPQHLNVY